MISACTGKSGDMSIFSMHDVVCPSYVCVFGVWLVLYMYMCSYTLRNLYMYMDCLPDVLDVSCLS